MLSLYLIERIRLKNIASYCLATYHFSVLVLDGFHCNCESCTVKKIGWFRFLAYRWINRKLQSKCNLKVWNLKLVSILDKAVRSWKRYFKISQLIVLQLGEQYSFNTLKLNSLSNFSSPNSLRLLISRRQLSLLMNKRKTKKYILKGVPKTNNNYHRLICFSVWIVPQNVSLIVLQYS